MAMNVRRVKPSTHSGRLASRRPPARDDHVAETRGAQQREQAPSDQRVTAAARLGLRSDN